MFTGFIILIILNMVVYDCKILRWVHDSKWSNPNNWNLNRVPCSKDIITLPYLESTPVVVFFQQDVSITEMRLPFHGELIFFNAGIAASQMNTNDPMCAVGGEIHFKTRERGWWLDDTNWCEVSRMEGVECMERPRFRLDTERVPCKADEVVFTKYSSLLVQVEANLALTVGVLKMFDKYQNTPSFISLVKNSDMSEQFFWPTTTTISIAGHTCKEVTDCECGNDVGKVKESICRRKTCPQNFLCTNWFTPEGHCCPVCGVSVTSTIDSSCFSARAFYFRVQDFLEQISANYMEMVNVSVAKISNNRIQVAIIDRTTNGEGIRVGNELKTLLEKSANEKKKVCLGSIDSISSISNFASIVDSQNHNRVGLGVSLFFLILIIIIVCILLFNNRYRIRRQYIPRMRERLSSLVASRGVTMEMGRRGVIFDNSVIFDSSLSAIPDPTFIGAPRSEMSFGTSEPSARLVDHDTLDATGRGSVNSTGSLFFEAGKKIKETVESINPRMLLSNLERKLSGEHSDFFHKRMVEDAELSSTPEGEFAFNNPVFGKQAPQQQLRSSSPDIERKKKKRKPKMDIEDSKLAFENPFFNEKNLKGS